MLEVIRLVLAIVVAAVRRRQRLVVENLLLRQQIQVVARSWPRPRLRARDTLSWLLIRCLRRDSPGRASTACTTVSTEPPDPERPLPSYTTGAGMAPGRPRLVCRKSEPRQYRLASCP